MKKFEMKNDSMDKLRSTEIKILSHSQSYMLIVFCLVRNTIP